MHKYNSPQQLMFPWTRVSLFACLLGYEISGPLSRTVETREIPFATVCPAAEEAYYFFLIQPLFCEQPHPEQSHK